MLTKKLNQLIELNLSLLLKIKLNSLFEIRIKLNLTELIQTQ